MTVLTVKAQDTATAMEEIVEKLGKNSFIIGTKKIGNEILVKATNNPKKEITSKNNKKEKFEEIISKEFMESSLTSSVEKKFLKKTNENNTKDFNISLNEKVIQKLSSDFNDLKDQLNSMILTDMAGLSPNLRSAVKIRLQKMGFSDFTLMKFRDKLVNKNTSEGIESFFEELAVKLTFDDPIKNLLECKYIFVVGASGSGKTSFSAKIAATLAQDTKKNVVALGKLGKQNEYLNDNLKSYSRLINVPNLDIELENASKNIENIEKKLIIDVSTETKDTLKIIESVKENVGSNKVLTILVIPSGSNKYSLNKIMNLYNDINPIIAFTKLDENSISAEELSVIAENNYSIGYLTETKSILKSINFTNKEILAQYLKDTFINFCK